MESTENLSATSPLHIMTVVGTRPELIRLSQTIRLASSIAKHTLVHTGQNYDYELNKVFFDELGLEAPDVYLGIRTETVGNAYADTIKGVEEAILTYKPNAFLVLGDTNSAISSVIAKRYKIPVYHMEAGNRSFDGNVPEEVNRRIVDHTADFNLAYTEHARRNLLSEGLEPRRVTVTGSPIAEIANFYRERIDASPILNDLGLEKEKFILVSTHREENVDNPSRLKTILDSLEAIQSRYNFPIVVSTHPRTKKRLAGNNFVENSQIRLLKPFGYFDYMALQNNAYCVVSDSGTISEESAICGFPAITIRDAIERHEAIETGSIIVSGISPIEVLHSIEAARLLYQINGKSVPTEYLVEDCSRRTIAFILSTYHVHHQWSGIRKW